ncbi:MAG: hypothetical protein GY903_30360 [Fuerstiella sp.]|nr:hypothetical protein [Fuerstiella sp.]MCP4858798.1 hypothetical protein [Fuerstiella sp.]
MSLIPGLRRSKSHSSFTGLAILLKDNESARSAEQLHSWIEQKSRSPQFESDDDFNRFAATGSDRYVLAADELAELAMNVQTLADSDLSLEERMGRHFLLCQAGIESRENLVALLKLAASDESVGLPALRLIKALTIEKADALPFVLHHAVAAKQKMQQQLADAKKKQTRVSASWYVQTDSTGHLPVR